MVRGFTPLRTRHLWVGKIKMLLTPLLEPLALKQAAPDCTSLDSPDIANIHLDQTTRVRFATFGRLFDARSTLLIYPRSCSLHPRRRRSSCSGGRCSGPAIGSQLSLHHPALSPSSEQLALQRRKRQAMKSPDLSRGQTTVRVWKGSACFTPECHAKALPTNSKSRLPLPLLTNGSPRQPPRAQKSIAT